MSGMDLSPQNLFRVIESSYREIVPLLTDEPLYNFPLCHIISADVLCKVYKDKEDIVRTHKEIDCIDEFKLAGFLAYWISKLKPVQAVVKPDKEEQYLNEYLSIAVAFSLVCEIYGIYPNISNKEDNRFLTNLLYTLRYRATTARNLPLVFEAYIRGYLSQKNSK